MADLRFAETAREFARLGDGDCGTGFADELGATNTKNAHPTRSRRNIRSGTIKLLPWRDRKGKLIIVHKVAGTGDESGFPNFTRILKTLGFFSDVLSSDCAMMSKPI
jgi:hypothetical protein